MNLAALALQSAAVCLLFTLFLIPGIKDPVRFLFNYPPAIQERVKSLKEYEGRIPTQQRKIGAKLVAALLFILIGIGLCKWAGVDDFWSAFFHMLIVFTAFNVYDLIVLDWILFRNLKAVRIPGTEDMDRAYKDYGYHFVGFLKGILIGIGVSLVVASAFLVL